MMHAILVNYPQHKIEDVERMYDKKVCKIYDNICWINGELKKRSREQSDKINANIKAKEMVGR